MVAGSPCVSDLSTVVVTGSIHIVFHADSQPGDDALVAIQCFWQRLPMGWVHASAFSWMTFSPHHITARHTVTYIM